MLAVSFNSSQVSRNYVKLAISLVEKTRLSGSMLEGDSED